MQLKIGEKIKQLRRVEQITQEALANVIGVTSQAISRWESGVGYPDMETLPLIAKYFRVTIDELLGYKDQADEDRLLYYNDKVNQIRDYRELVPILRAAVQEFPTNDWLCFRLAEALFHIHITVKGGMVGVEDKNAPSANTSERVEAIAMFKRLLKKTDDGFVRGQSAKYLIGHYKEKGEYDEAEKIVRSLPGVSDCREIARAHAAPKESYHYFLQRAIIDYITSMAHAIRMTLLGQDDLGISVKIKKLEELVQVCHILFDGGRFGYAHQDMRSLYQDLAILYVKSGDMDAAYKNLDMMLYHVKTFNALFNSGEYRLGGELFNHVVCTFEGDIRTDLSDMVDGMRMVYPETVKALEQDPRWEEWISGISE